MQTVPSLSVAECGMGYFCARKQFHLCINVMKTMLENHSKVLDTCTKIVRKQDAEK